MSKVWRPDAGFRGGRRSGLLFLWPPDLRHSSRALPDYGTRTLVQGQTPGLSLASASIARDMRDEQPGESAFSSSTTAHRRCRQSYCQLGRTRPLEAWDWRDSRIELGGGPSRIRTEDRRIKSSLALGCWCPRTSIHDSKSQASVHGSAA
jgi:hypothetical protein